MKRTMTTSPKEIDPLFAEERQIGILQAIEQQKKVMVNDLVKRFGVSGVTIRTDLRDLERAGQLIRTHGGAIATTKTGFEPNTRQKEIHFSKEKSRIAAAALALIDDGDTIILDTGTTTLELARILRARKKLTVVTNDLEIARTLEDCSETTICLLGGIVRKGFHCTISVRGIEVGEGITVDKAFMGANGFSLSKGATTPDIGQAHNKKQMIKMAARVILLCDHSKLGRVSLAQFATANEIHALVTDRLDDTERDRICRHGIEVITAA